MQQDKHLTEFNENTSDAGWAMLPLSPVAHLHLTLSQSRSAAEIKQNNEYKEKKYAKSSFLLHISIV